jgi:hypothetical protein
VDITTSQATALAKRILKLVGGRIYPDETGKRESEN